MKHAGNMHIIKLDLVALAFFKCQVAICLYSLNCKETTTIPVRFLKRFVIMSTSKNVPPLNLRLSPTEQENCSIEAAI